MGWGERNEEWQSGERNREREQSIAQNERTELGVERHENYEQMMQKRDIIITRG